MFYFREEEQIFISVQRSNFDGFSLTACVCCAPALCSTLEVLLYTAFSNPPNVLLPEPRETGSRSGCCRVVLCCSFIAPSCRDIFGSHLVLILSWFSNGLFMLPLSSPHLPCFSHPSSCLSHLLYPSSLSTPPSLPLPHLYHHKHECMVAALKCVPVVLFLHLLSWIIKAAVLLIPCRHINK